MVAKKKEQAEKESRPVKPAKRKGLPPGSGDPRGEQARVVRDLITKAATDLMGKKRSSTLADYIKLAQLQNDLEVDLPRDIKVGWVDHLEKDGEK